MGIKKSRGYKKKIYSLLIASTIAMGLLGTSYAYWTDGLEIKASVSTGKIDIEDIVTILHGNGRGFNLSNGNGSEGQQIKSVFTIVNNSNIPISDPVIKSIKVRPIECGGDSYVHSSHHNDSQCIGVDVTEELREYIAIEFTTSLAEESIEGSIEIDKHDENGIIRAAMQKADGTYKFEQATVDIELEFGQMNNSNGWSDTTILSIGVTCSNGQGKDLELLVPTPLPMPKPEEVPGPGGSTEPTPQPEESNPTVSETVPEEESIPEVVEPDAQDIAPEVITPEQ